MRLKNADGALLQWHRNSERRNNHHKNQKIREWPQGKGIQGISRHGVHSKTLTITTIHFRGRFRSNQEKTKLFYKPDLEETHNLYLICTFLFLVVFRHLKKF